MKHSPAFSFEPRVSFASSAERIRDMVVAAAEARGDEIAPPAVAIPMRAESKPFMGWDWKMPTPKARVSKAMASGIAMPAVTPTEPKQRHPRRQTAASAAPACEMP